MNIFDKFFKKAQVNNPLTGPISTAMNQARFSLGGSRNEKALMDQYKNWVFACVNARASDLSSIELILKNKKDGKIIVESEVLDLLDDVNPNTTKLDLFFDTQAFLDMTGNAYWLLAREGKNREGKVRQIYLLSPDRVDIVVAKDNAMRIVGYTYKSPIDNKTLIPFETNEIIHFKTFNPKGGYPYPHKGMGIVEASIFAIESDNEAREWNYSFFKNSAKPDGILTTPGKLSEEQFKRLQQQWIQKHGGSSNNGKTAILESGLTWTEVSKSQKDMDFVAQRTFSRDEILSLFRVPKTIIGITDDVNRANAEASEYVFAKRTIKPLMKAFVTHLNEYLLPMFDDNLKFDFVDPTPRDNVLELQARSLGYNKWLTRNDIRVADGLEPSADGDTFFGPMSDIPQDSVTRTKAVNERVSKGTKSKDILEKVLKSIKKEKRLNDSQKSVFKDSYEKRFDRNEVALMKTVKKFFAKQEVEVLKNLEEEFDGLKAKEFKMKSVDDVLFDMDTAVKASISFITPYIRTFLKDGAEMADSITSHDTDTNAPAFIKFINNRSKFFAESINETTANQLLTSIKEGINAEESLGQIQDRVKEVYKDAETYRTLRIARTEVSASLNEGSVQAYTQAGIKKLEWLAIVDGSTSDQCLENDGEIRSIGDSFSAGASQPPQHVNCRCTVVAVFEE